MQPITSETSTPDPAASPAAVPMRILVVGASGYVGGRLAARLVERGHHVRLASRDPRGLADRFPTAEVVRLDLLDPATLPAALEGVELAYYLAHSMAGGEAGFEQRDLRRGAAFARAAQRGRASATSSTSADSVTRTADSPRISPAASRSGRSWPRTASRSRSSGPPSSSAPGSASFELLRSLVEHLPVMITPRWVRTLCQPIAIRDVLEYLVAAAGHPERAGVVEIGGPDVLSYAEMMRTYARLRGMRRLMIPVPVLTPRLSSYWCSLVTPVPSAIARPLIEGLRNEVVVRDPAPAAAFGVATTPVRAGRTAGHRARRRPRRRDHLVRLAGRLRSSGPGRGALSRGHDRGPPAPLGARRRCRHLRRGRAARRHQPAGRTPTRSGGSAACWTVPSAGPGCAWAGAIRTTSASATPSTSGAWRRCADPSCCACGPR